MLKTITPEQVLLLMCQTSTQHPMTDGEIASLLDTKRDHVNEVLDQLYEGKAIGSCKNIKGGIECRQVWVTGLPYRPVFATRATPSQPIRTPVQPIKQEPTMDDAKANQALPETTSKELQIVTFIWLANGAPVTGSEIKKFSGAGTIDSYIEWYLKHGHIIKTPKEAGKPITYSFSPSTTQTAKELYDYKKSVAYKDRFKKDSVADPIKPVNTAVNPRDEVIDVPKFLRKAPAENIDKKSHAEAIVDFVNETVPKRETVLAHIQAQQDAITENQRRFRTQAVKPTIEDRQELNKVFDKLIAEEKADIEFKLEPKPDDPVRFALTSDGTLIIMGISYQPIELTKPQTNRLIEFMENTAGINL